jgi:hypothetical protein
MKLNVLAFGLACGCVWGLGLFCLTWWVMAFEGATGDLMVLGHIYRGFNISPLGSVVGLTWALIDGFIAGAMLAWIYNLLMSCWTDLGSTPSPKAK